MPTHSDISPDSVAAALAVEIQQKFRSWRQSSPRGIRRISENLWRDAARLASLSTVHMAARLLGLDFVQLKKRVIAIYGQDCPALSRRSGKCAFAIIAPTPGERFHPLDPSGSPQRLLEPPLSPTAGLSTQTPGDHAVSRPKDGFLEATMGESPWAGPPILAEIRTPAGCVMRLFSPDTDRIVRAFVQP